MAKKFKSTRVYGWKPDKPDHRDHLFAFDVNVEVPLKASVDQWAPPIMDQGQLGACTAHGITGALRLNKIKLGVADVPRARLQLYYDERALEKTTKSDAGAEIRDGIKTLAKKGVAAETLWPYDITKFKTKPPKNVYTDALKEQALTYESVPVNATAIKAAIAAGHAVIIGISVFESFESAEVAKTGVVPMPGHGESLLGGHCLYVTGYGDKTGYFTVRNSWGTSWGDGGKCYIPEGYLGSPSYGSDYWIIKTQE